MVLEDKVVVQHIDLKFEIIVIIIILGGGVLTSLENWHALKRR